MPLMPLESAHDALENRVLQHALRHAEEEAAVLRAQTHASSVVQQEGALASATQHAEQKQASQRIGSAQLALLMPIASDQLAGPASQDEDMFFSGSDGEKTEVADGFVHLLDLDRREDAALNFNTLSALYAEGQTFASNMLSADQYKTLLQEKLSLGYNFTIWCLDERHEFNLQELPDFKKQEVATMLDIFITDLNGGKFGRFLGESVIQTNIENIKMFMFSESIPINKEKFKKHFILDSIRNKDFFEYFPEHENMREYIQ